MSSSSPETAELMLKAEQQKIEAIFYGVESPLVIFRGPELVYEMLNAKYQAIYPTRELLGRPLLEAVPELKDSSFPAILKGVYETGKHHFSHEGLARIRNVATGELEERYFDTAFSRISYGDDKPYRIIATPREVTDRVLARKNVEANLIKLRDERQFREKFISALSHDLRTPLTVTLSLAEILKLRPEDPEMVRALADRIIGSAKLADRMIRDLLDTDRISAGKGLPISVQKCRLDLLVGKTMSDLQDLHGKRFRLINNCGEISGYWDEMALQRIVENLASNAIKYGSPGSPVTLVLDAGADWVELAVHNEGKAIPPEEQAALFYQYHRAESAISSGQKGWGVGLTIVKGLVEAHRGHVRLESSPVSGTTFILRLPLDARNTSS